MKGDTPQDAADKKEIGRTIRRLRTMNNLTQEQLAEKMSILFGRKYTANMISLYENGGDHMQVGILFDFATFFGVPIQDLIPSRLISGYEAVLYSFRQLTPDNQAIIEKMLKLMLKDSDSST